MMIIPQLANNAELDAVNTINNTVHLPSGRTEQHVPHVMKQRTIISALQIRVPRRWELLWLDWGAVSGSTMRLEVTQQQSAAWEDPAISAS